MAWSAPRTRKSLSNSISHPTAPTSRRARSRSAEPCTWQARGSMLSRLWNTCVRNTAMLDTPSAQVPALSLNDEASDPDAFAAALGGSFERFGFAVIADHGVPQDLIDRAWEETKKLFALPEEEKRGYFVPGGGGARGYTPFKTEIAKDAKHVDLKEFWHVGRELPAGHRFADQMTPNVWPTRPEGFRDVFL